VSECDDLQLQRCAGANEKAERVEQRNDDRRNESRLSKNVGNLNRHNVYGVFNRHSGFDAVFEAEHIRIVRTPIQVPEANGIAERFVRTARSEYLDWLLILNARIWSDPQLDRADLLRTQRAGRKHLQPRLRVRHTLIEPAHLAVARHDARILAPTRLGIESRRRSRGKLAFASVALWQP